MPSLHSNKRPSRSTPITTIVAFTVMDQIAKGLLHLTVPTGPFMRLEDTLLSDEEAHATAVAMYDLVKDRYKWKWPSLESHLANTQVKNDRDAEYRIQAPDEEKREYIQRMKRLDAWPQKEANGHAQWLSCALVTAYALDYLQRSSNEGQPLRGKSGDYRYYFNPKKFYEYTWMCLNQGHGPRSWKQSPKLPEVSMANIGAWYSKNASVIVETTIERWDTGVELEDILPVLTLDDLLPSPKDQELIRSIKNKLKQGSAAGIRKKSTESSRPFQIEGVRTSRRVAGRPISSKQIESTRKRDICAARLVIIRITSST